MIESRPSRPWDLTPAAERDYFGVLGEGLVAEVAPRPSARGGGWSPPSGGAWLHVGPTGGIRAFTGKAEVGQGTRVALALGVAEELRVPLPSVQLTMADTDLCPWDMGTFGSRSMADAAPPLRRAAAGAREALVRLAVESGVGALGELEADDGRVRHRTSGHSLDYGELVRGRKVRVAVPPDIPLTPPTAWRRAGRDVVDPDAADVVTGRRTYASDQRRVGMRFGAVLRPPAYGARLVSVDDRRAREKPDVTVVHDGDFVGVVGTTPAAARAALDEIDADWELAPQPTESEIEGFLRAHPSSGDSWDTAERRAGDALGAVATAAATVEATYRSAYIAHVPLETRSALAEWSGSRVTVWIGTQTPFRAREAVSEGLGIPPEDVRIVVPFTGAGFGGKHGGPVAMAVTRLARAAGAPVLLTYSREEEFRHGYFRPMALVDLRAGASADGRLVAWRFHNVNAGAAAIEPPYAIPNVEVDNELSESPLPQDPYRALAANANNFARESAIDELAARLGLDPLEIRDKNLADDRLRTVLRAAASRAGWAGRRRENGAGFGLAVGLEKGGRVATVAEVRVAADRSLSVRRLVVVFESGAVVHPENLRSQVEGAAVMALGGALFEAIHFADGRVLNDRLKTYRVPRFWDVPEVEVELVDRRDLPSGGAGETPMIAVAPAVANAIYDACGVRLRSLPLAPNGTVPDVPA